MQINLIEEPSGEVILMGKKKIRYVNAYMDP